MPRVAIAYDRALKAHDTGPRHPERPERLDAVGAALEWSGLMSTALRVGPQPVEREVLEQLHEPDYIDRVERACRAGAPFVDEPDCAACPATYELALRAAGMTVQCARAIGRCDVRRALAAVRPPGHHAERNRARGFCYFNNVALAAVVLRREFELERVLIFDWDVHHGNGTQHLFERDPSVLFVSVHEHPDHQYPGTGYAQETGLDAGEGFTINVPLLPGTDEKAYRLALTSRGSGGEPSVLDSIDAFAPQAVLISAGFDAHADDPLGRLKLTDETFVWLAQELIARANATAGGRVLSVLEGGYNLDVLRRCVAEHVHLLDVE